MKRIYVYISLLFIAIISFSACKKYLDITPKGYVIPSKVEDFERILNDRALYNFLRSDLDMSSDDFYDPEINNPNTAPETKIVNLYYWNPDPFIDEQDIKTSIWATAFGNIYQFNAVINGITDSEGATPARIKKAIAQAKFGRAVMYWYLVNVYSKPYHKQTANGDLGIPLVTKNDLAIDLPKRGTVQQTYDFILKDLNEALDGVSASVPNPYFVSQQAVHGFLARTYLMMGEYEKAKQAAEKALGTNPKLIDYNTVYQEKTITTVTPNVSYLGTKSGSNPLLDRLTMPENIFAMTYNYYGGMMGEVIAKQTVDLFDAKDLRRIFFKPKVAAGDKTWSGLYSYLDQLIYVNPGISSPEMYLIRAEGKARADDLAGAMADLDILRKNRFKPADFMPLSTTDKKDAIAKVLLERRFELFYKASRWFDMRRLNNDPDFGFTAKRYFNNGTFIELPPNSNAYTLKLPQTALTNNIVQNP
ncbi:RagB/SusD family nutrient uptake outer membrane protein [Pedobacter sp. MW01-1-1]|uniref:RagB/SusD family nutrient uptake outer membrane protein n=1 Tax=Pedobacter sp. MW01-1-1 TaxID=3383027 RepID=UPI003FEEC345